MIGVLGMDGYCPHVHRVLEAHASASNQMLLFVGGLRYERGFRGVIIVTQFDSLHIDGVVSHQCLIPT